MGNPNFTSCEKVRRPKKVKSTIRIDFIYVYNGLALGEEADFILVLFATQDLKFFDYPLFVTKISAFLLRCVRSIYTLKYFIVPLTTSEFKMY